MRNSLAHRETDTDGHALIRAYGSGDVTAEQLVDRVMPRTTRPGAASVTDLRTLAAEFRSDGNVMAPLADTLEGFARNGESIINS